MNRRKLGWLIVVASAALLLLFAPRACYQFVGRGRQGIQGGPNTLLCLVDYEDGSAPKSAHAKFMLVDTLSIVPFHSDPVSESRKAGADANGKVALLWNDNSGVWLNEIHADGKTYSRDPAARGDRVPFWDGYTVGPTSDGRSTTAVAVHHLARVTLHPSTATFLVEHIRDVARQ